MNFRHLILVFGLASGASAVWAQSAPQDALIEKFTLVHLRLAPNDPARVGVTLRLADLHAERARQNSVEDLLKGEKDRLQALRYYREAVKQTPPEGQARIWIQMGHLNELNGESAEALKVYGEVLKSNASPEQQADANLSIAEVYFKQRQFARAQEHYQQVINNPKSNSRGFAAYRNAWVEFNTGKTESGIAELVKILRSPELSRRSAAPSASADQQFQEEVSRDLATFMAKRRVKADDLTLLYEVSPSSTKIANVMFLAGEAERLGQVEEALQLWKFVYEKQTEPRERLESLIHMAGLQIGKGGGDEALQSYQDALQLWARLEPCTDASCGELKIRLKNMVVDWNRLEKKNPSVQLAKAYQAYSEVFPEETSMRLYLAQVAREQKNYALALATYLKVGRASAPESEAALIAAIETAELAMAAEEASRPKTASAAGAGPSEGALQLKSAYDAYVTFSKKKERLTEVRYQQAKWSYDNGDLENGANALRAFALDSAVQNEKLRDQAANLALDAIAIQKDDQRLRIWAEEFAQALPKTAEEKRQVARKALLNQSAQMSDKKEYAQAWTLLEKENFTQAPAADRVLLLKNKLILAEKLNLFPQARLIVDELLAQPHLSPEDQQYAWSRKAWLAEMVLDFESALTATQKMKDGEIPADQRLLKLAMYADLSAQEPRPFYQQYLKVSKDSASRVAIASQLVKSSPQPLKEIEVQRTVLAENPEVLGQLYLELYGQTQDVGILKKALSQPTVAKSKSGPLLQRQEFLRAYAEQKQKLGAMVVDGANMKKMANDLKARVKALAEAEKLANQVIASGDWTSQVLVLTLLAAENERFYQEIMALPLPHGLSAEEEQEYLQALSQQASPHLTKAQDLKVKVAEFWQNAEAVPQLEKSLDLATVEVRPLIAREMDLLIQVAPADRQAQLKAIVAKPTSVVAEKPSLQLFETAKAKVRENPMDLKSVRSLLELEQKWGRPSMVSYLKGRVESLEKASTGSEQVKE